MIQTEQPAFSPIQWRWPDKLRLPPLIWLFALLVAVGSWIWLPDGGHDWVAGGALAATHWWPTPWLYNFPLSPWGALLLSPLGGLPVRLETALNNGVTVIILAMVARQLGGPAWITLPILISPAGYFLFHNGQFDWLMLLAILMFNGLDLVILAVKPQVAFFIIVPRLRRARTRWLAYLTPLIVVSLASLIIWPLWPVGVLNLAREVNMCPCNGATWPWGVPIGLGFLWYAWRTEDDRWGIAATPFLVPYINIYSYVGMFVALGARWPRILLLMWVLMWLVGTVMFFGQAR